MLIISYLRSQSAPDCPAPGRQPQFHTVSSAPFVVDVVAIDDPRDGRGYPPRARAYGMITRTNTRAGRVGRARDKKSRVGPWRPQNGHVSSSVSNSGRSPTAIGASQRPHAKVPVPSSVDLIVWRFSSCGAARRISGESSGVWPRPRKSVTMMSLKCAGHPRSIASDCRSERHFAVSLGTVVDALLGRAA